MGLFESFRVSKEQNDPFARQMKKSIDESEMRRN